MLFANCFTKNISRHTGEWEEKYSKQHLNAGTRNTMGRSSLSIYMFVHACVHVFVCPFSHLFVTQNSPYPVGNFPSYVPDHRDGRSHNTVHLEVLEACNPRHPPL